MLTVLSRDVRCACAHATGIRMYGFATVVAATSATLFFVTGKLGIL